MINTFSPKSKEAKHSKSGNHDDTNNVQKMDNFLVNQDREVKVKEEHCTENLDVVIRTGYRARRLRVNRELLKG